MGDHYDPRISIMGAGTPMVLVPGMDGTGQLFYRQVPKLARSFRVATYALRDAATRMDTLVEDLAGVIDLVSGDEQRAIVVGESFGGALAMSLAAAAPHKVAALVVINSFPCFSPQFRLHLAIAGLSALPWGAMTFVRRMTAFRLHSRHTHRDDIDRFMKLTEAATREGYLNRLRVLTRFDVREHLAGFRMPTLFIAADRDHLVPSLQQARFMAGRVPGATLHVLTGHGHICLIAPDLDLSEIVAGWLP
jgi:pimeloyl-ACP methyl ester carboxylesterase